MHQTPRHPRYIPPIPKDRKKRDRGPLLLWLIPLVLLAGLVGGVVWRQFFRVSVPMLPAFPRPALSYRFRDDIAVQVNSRHAHGVEWLKSSSPGGQAVMVFNVTIKNNSNQQLMPLASVAGLQTADGQIHVSTEGVPELSIFPTCVQCVKMPLTAAILPGGTAIGDLHFIVAPDVQPTRVGFLAP